MTTFIPLQDTVRLDAARAQFEKHVDKGALESYRLPVADPNTDVIVGLSGGADSSVLWLFCALYLAPHYRNMVGVFTDTLAEPESCYDTLDKLDRLTGIPIVRLEPEQGLFERINHYNGFLPSGQQRWCTRELKIAPLTEYLSRRDTGRPFINLAGIRADESDREGIQFQHQMEQGAAAYPFVELGITRDMVFDILDNTIGIPSTYAYRSRSGCFSCMFQRNQEIVGMLHHEPGHFAASEAMEKLSESDIERWTLPDRRPLGMGHYPIPAFVDIRQAERVPAPEPKAPRRSRDTQTGSLFDDAPAQSRQDSLFCAIALYVDERLGLYGGSSFTPGTYWQEFVTVSTSLPGLKVALGNYYHFRTATPVPGRDAADMKIVIVKIDFPHGVIDTRPPSEDSYTWKSSVAYRQLRHLVEHCEAVLEYEDAGRQLKDAIRASGAAQNNDDLLDAQEAAEIAACRVKGMKAPDGKLVWEGLYIPTKQSDGRLQLELEGVSTTSRARPARENLEFDEVPMACIACSL